MNTEMTLAIMTIDGTLANKTIDSIEDSTRTVWNLAMKVTKTINTKTEDSTKLASNNNITIILAITIAKIPQAIERILVLLKMIDSVLPERKMNRTKETTLRMTRYNLKTPDATRRCKGPMRLNPSDTWIKLAITNPAGQNAPRKVCSELGTEFSATTELPLDKDLQIFPP